MSAKENPMNKTIISILIWLVCMPCMLAAETSKELEEAKEKAKKEANALFDTYETEAYTEKVRKLMDLCLKANDEELYYKSWSNLATFTFRHNPQKGLKVADEMRDYAKEHDSKYGLITALYTQANMSVKWAWTIGQWNCVNRPLITRTNICRISTAPIFTGCLPKSTSLSIGRKKPLTHLTEASGSPT